jgi:hypothetical protein
VRVSEPAEERGEATEPEVGGARFRSAEGPDPETKGGRRRAQPNRARDGWELDAKGAHKRAPEGSGAEVDGALNCVSGAVIGAAIAVHRQLGPGLLESAYETCLVHELTARGFEVERQFPVPVVYRGVRIERAYRMDMVVSRLVAVEVKAVESLLRVHSAQLLSYLRLANLKLGLLINFRTPLLKHGIRRLRIF